MTQSATDKQLLIEMLDRANANYAVSDKCGNSICVGHKVEFLFNANDMLEHIEDMEGWL